ncbi:hypothetical protein JTB14_014042 [Gonioctena quinquepunctata]|nr:hypothetical protein JTB14_014042 [Gonioctena quinquepunctata]
MKSLVAVLLVMVSIASAEPPVRGYSSNQASAPYPPSGWKPDGPAFRLPIRNQRNQEPATLYGPPPQQYGPPESEVTTTETATTTTEAATEQTTSEPQAENLKQALRPKSEKLRSQKTEQAAPVYVVVPQAQQLVFSSPLRATPSNLVAINRPEKLVEVKEPNPVPVQAVPALAQIQAAQAPLVVEQYPQAVQFQQIQAIPVENYYGSFVSRTSVVSPYSSSFVQIYQ